MIRYTKYKGKWKYLLIETYSINTGIRVYKQINHQYFTLTTRGRLTIYAGYTWDGATGFFDLESIMRGSLVHDVFCQMIRLKLLPFYPYRRLGDILLRTICLADKMQVWLAWTVYFSVRIYAEVKTVFK